MAKTIIADNRRSQYRMHQTRDLKSEVINGSVTNQIKKNKEGYYFIIKQRIKHRYYSIIR